MKAFSSFYSLDHLKRSIQPYEFYLREQSHSKFRRSGKWVEAGLCPFHNDRNAGSFYFDIETVILWEKQIVLYMKNILNWNEQLTSKFCADLTLAIKKAAIAE